MLILDDIYQSPTSLNAVVTIEKRLIENGFTKVETGLSMNIKKGGKYYTIKNGSSILAFTVGKRLSKPGFNVVASHLDCPTFKLKPEPVVKCDGYYRLNVEKYGGAILNTWYDRPLSLAGRVVSREKDRIVSQIINIDKDLLLIPNLAIHQNHDVNNGLKVSVQNDMLPVIGLKEEVDFKKILEKYSGIAADKIISFDLYLYPRMKGLVWGDKDEFISSFHLDNLECAFTSLYGFLEGKHQDNINVYVSFDAEEVGSRTAEGAGSTFLFDTLSSIARSLDLDYLKMLNNTLLVSADNAHAIHPAYPNRSDQNNHPYMNEGIVVKYNAAKSYVSDGLSSGLFKAIMDKNKVRYQNFANNSDYMGGGTLGSISTSQVSVLSVDIGLPTLAMHSCFETGGKEDVEMMVKGLKSFYSTHIVEEDGDYLLK